MCERISFSFVSFSVCPCGSSLSRSELLIVGGRSCRFKNGRAFDGTPAWDADAAAAASNEGDRWLKKLSAGCPPCGPVKLEGCIARGGEEDLCLSSLYDESNVVMFSQLL
jgi:hypothetical protein